jgi:hypothetical protein
MKPIYGESESETIERDPSVSLIFDFLQLLPTAFNAPEGTLHCVTPHKLVAILSAPILNENREFELSATEVIHLPNGSDLQCPDRTIRVKSAGAITQKVVDD